MISKAKLIKDLRVMVDNGRAHTICLDLPPELGTDMGPTALEFGVMSFSGCFATIFSLTAKKMRIQIEDLEVELNAQKSEKTGTIASAEFDITVKSDAGKDRIHRIFEITQKNCPVGKLFEQAGVKISYNLKHIKK
ncbi:OsmC family protein [Candidatus Bathyarchaeota archaeon]|nr:OsmC family protein [Candidatus Bathyarchaeota archaeon]